MIQSKAANVSMYVIHSHLNCEKKYQYLLYIIYRNYQIIIFQLIGSTNVKDLDSKDSQEYDSNTQTIVYQKMCLRKCCKSSF